MKTKLQSIALALFLLVFLSNNETFAQLTGGSVYTIDNTVSGSGNLFPNTNTFNGFATAVTALNATSANSLSSAVTFNVNAGQTFIESPLTITYTNGNGANPSIIFQRNGAGANPVVLGTNGTGSADYILTINGGDYYTLNGIDFTDNPANNTGIKKMEAGIFFNGQATDGCQNNTIENCTVTLDKTNNNITFCIYMVSNALSSAGANSNNTFSSNTVQNALNGYYFAINSFSIDDDGNVIDATGNGRSVVANIGTTTTNNDSTTAYHGIYFENQDNFTVSNTNINNLTYYNNKGASGSLDGIDCGSGGFGFGNTTFTFNNDTIQSLTIATGSTGTADIGGIYLNDIATTNNIYNNVISNLNTSVIGGFTYAIWNGPVFSFSNNINIYSNTITGLTCNSKGAYEAIGIVCNGGTYAIYSNTFTNFIGGSHFSLDVNATAMYIVSPTDYLSQLHDNTISGLSADSGDVVGIYLGAAQGTIPPIYNNHISNLFSNGAAFVCGMTLSGEISTVYDNKIYNLTSNGTTGKLVMGIEFNFEGGASNPSTFYNNMIYDLRADNARDTVLHNAFGGNVIGVNITGFGGSSNRQTGTQFYFNTIFLNGAATNSKQVSTGLFIEAATIDTNVYDIRDNIIDNSYTGGTGVALWAANVNNVYRGIDVSSNYNLLYAGTPSAKNLLFYGKAVDSIQTLSAYKTKMLPREQNSKSVDPLFVSTTGTIDVHIQSTSPASQAGITVGGIATDIDGDTRPSPSATHPDMGADEINSATNCNAAAGIITAVRDTICSGTAGNLSLAGNSVGDSIHWQSSTDNINFTTIANENGTTLKTTALLQSTYFRVIVGSGGCTAISASYLLIVPPALVSNYTSNVAGTVVAFSSATSTGNISRYSWDFGDGSNSSVASPSHTYAGLNKDSAYYACLTLYDGSNCSYTFCAYVEILANGVLFLNGDDYFAVYPSPFSNYFTVSSRQGSGKIEQVQVYDVLGRLALVKNLDNGGISSVQIEGATLTANEIYYVKIKTTTAEYVTKVVKE